MPIAAGFSLERHTKLVTRNLRFEVGPFNSFQSPGCKFRSTSRSLPVCRRALDPLTIPGAGFVVNQAAKRFGAIAKPFSEAREDIPKLSPVNPKTVARETGFSIMRPLPGSMPVLPKDVSLRPVKLG